MKKSPSNKKTAKKSKKSNKQEIALRDLQPWELQMFHGINLH